MNTDDVTKFTYKEDEYTILEDNVSNSELGEWVGYIRQLVAIDETGSIVVSENIKTAMFENLQDLVDTDENAKYIIPFLNVYAALDDDIYLIVDENGGYHKAVTSDSITNDDTVFDFTHIPKSTSGEFEINPQNATQLLYGDEIYQVTNETVSNEELGDFIDIVAEKVTFNADTKKPLSKEELNTMDWSGINSNEQRESWFYVDVYEVSNIDANVVVAVKVNGQYYKASKQ